MKVNLTKNEAEERGFSNGIDADVGLTSHAANIQLKTYSNMNCECHFIYILTLIKLGPSGISQVDLPLYPLT